MGCDAQAREGRLHVGGGFSSNTLPASVLSGGGVQSQMSMETSVRFVICINGPTNRGRNQIGRTGGYWPLRDRSCAERCARETQHENAARDKSRDRLFTRSNDVCQLVSTVTQN